MDELLAHFVSGYQKTSIRIVFEKMEKEVKQVIKEKDMEILRLKKELANYQHIRERE